MSKNKINAIETTRVQVKSKFYAEFRRFSVERDMQTGFKEFRALLQRLHRLKRILFRVFYVDHTHQDLIPINNDDNLRIALLNAKPLLRVFICHTYISKKLRNEIGDDYCYY